MKFSIIAASCLQLAAGLAIPIANGDIDSGLQLFSEGSRGGARGEGAKAGAAGGAAGGAEGGMPAEGGVGQGEGEGEGEGNELELQGVFDQPVTLQGGDIKQDTLYPPGTNGGFEVEFQNAAGNTLTVAENPAPAPPPAGFSALEPVSYIVNLTDSAAGATLQKIDYILTAGNALDISKGKVGKLDAATNTFIIDETVGELEFEVEENELTLTVADLNGEWAVFVPAAAAGGGEGGNAGGDAGAAPTTGSSILDSVLKLIGEGAAAADAKAAAGKAVA